MKHPVHTRIDLRTLAVLAQKVGHSATVGGYGPLLRKGAEQYALALVQQGMAPSVDTDEEALMVLREFGYPVKESNGSLQTAVQLPSLAAPTVSSDTAERLALTARLQKEKQDARGTKEGNTSS
jgi:hypothetical protein